MTLEDEIKNAGRSVGGRVSVLEEEKPADDKKALAREEAKIATNAFGQADYETAQQHYERALEFDPTNAAIHSALGYVAFNKQEHSAAVGHFENAVRFDSN